MTGTPDCSFTRNFQVSGIERSQGWILVVMQRLQSGLIAFAFLIAFSFSLGAATPPIVGQKAPDFALQSMEGVSVQLSRLTQKSPVVLVVLRGYPGYDCPYCQRQVRDFVQKAKDFTAAGVQITFIYPGPPDELKMRANSFLADKDFPKSFLMLLDPGYTFTNLYGLRWDAPQETAYPSTFLIDQTGTVFFSKTVKSHSDRMGGRKFLTNFDRTK